MNPYTEVIKQIIITNYPDNSVLTETGGGNTNIENDEIML